ncbi:C2H2-type domain-containing protein [Favolaschia claudopus]|uniref:C2H2-type domain-containing protein n=1 Tax=Favolaschia claudopus TaxID=2862362 RepID=A0AAW0EDE2_9AGAR
MASNGRRTHRKKVSALRLSSDTTSTLPEYMAWRDVVPPPEYEADDADDEEPSTPASPRSIQHRRSHRRRASSPRMQGQHQQDDLLDSLLERSVHALELSNALLQSSMSPTVAPEPFSDPSPPAATRPVRMPSGREPAWADDLAAIARDVDDLVSSSLPASVSPVSTRKPPKRRPSLDPAPVSSRSSVSYFSPRSTSPTASTTSYTSTSASTTSYTSNGSGTSTGTGGLRMAPAARQRLVAPAPRALTQYIDANVLDSFDDGHIALPSTIGLRAPPSDWSPSRDEEEVPQRPSDGLPRAESDYGYRYHPSRPPHVEGLPRPQPFTFPRDKGRPEENEWVTVGARDWAPDAAAALRNAVGTTPKPPTHSSSSSSSRAAFSPTLPNIAGSLPTIASLAGLSSKLSSSPKLGLGTSSNVSQSTKRGRSESRSLSSRPTLQPQPSSLSHSTPDLRLTIHPNSSQIIANLPSESPTHSTQSSECDSTECGRAKEARSALRRILDEAPKPPPPPKKQFLPRTPPPAAHAAPSTATASVSRLFSKGGRHSVTQPAPAPPVGIMKGKNRNSLSAPPTPISTTPNNNAEAGPSNSNPPTAKEKEFGSSSLFFGVVGTRRSRPGSGASTPSAKRISFAELPESYAASTGKGKGKATVRSGKSKSKGKGNGRKRGGGEGSEEGEGGGWLSWFAGGLTAGPGMGLGLGLGGGGMEERERISAGRGGWGWGLGDFVGGGGGRGLGMSGRYSHPR